MGLRLFTSQDGINFNEDSHSDKIFIIISMALQKITARILGLRALIIVSALISLCVSNNVGPSFLPLPVVRDRPAEKPQDNQGDTASRWPSPAESDSFRVPMMGQKQNRAATEPQTQPFATTPKSDFVLPDDSRVPAELCFAVSFFTSASVSQPPGRAPPRLV